MGLETIRTARHESKVNEPTDPNAIILNHHDCPFFQSMLHLRQASYQTRVDPLVVGNAGPKEDGGSSVFYMQCEQRGVIQVERQDDLLVTSSD